MIYAVQVLDQKFVKIGYCRGPTALARISALQTGCPFKITELFSIEGTLLQEKSLHAALTKAFARIRIQVPPNEWYPGRNQFFQGFLAHLKYGFDVGLTYAEQHNQFVEQKDSEPADPPPAKKWPTLRQRRRPNQNIKNGQYPILPP